jgi:hypothetical protein
MDPSISESMISSLDSDGLREGERKVSPGYGVRMKHGGTQPYVKIPSVSSLDPITMLCELRYWPALGQVTCAHT